MNRTVEKGKTLLIDGPASVTVTSGKVEAFGFTLSNNRVVIRDGKRLPFAVEETAVFSVSLGENAAAEEVDGYTIPPSWTKAYEDLRDSQAAQITAIVLGGIDSGKTSFCTYLTNRLLRQKRQVAILDGDLGQSDIGPPCTVAYAFVSKPVTDLFGLRGKNAFFIGATSPNGNADKVIEGMTALRQEILDANSGTVIVNTDGWIEGQDAVGYKVRLVQALAPDMIFYIQQKDEMAPIMAALESYKGVMVDCPATIRQRTREKRRDLRELGYIKYLKNSKVQSLPLNWLRIEGDEPFGLNKPHANAEQTRRIHELLGMRPLHFTEQENRIRIVVGKRRWIGSDNIRKLEEALGKKVMLIHKGDEEGLLAALYDAEKRFLGIGVLQEIDLTRKILKISTPVAEEISAVNIGKVKLDKNLREIPDLTDENRIDFSELKKLF
jgi:polynucleotide 5'-hydroxyl-kinase GRC3/NOL9